MSDPAWCRGSGAVPADVRTIDETTTGLCWRCQRRVKLTTDGRTRRHGTESRVETVDGKLRQRA